MKSKFLLIDHPLSYLNSKQKHLLNCVLIRFVANSWLMKITSNGTYLFASTLNGKVFLFDLLSGNVVKILNDHDGENFLIKTHLKKLYVVLIRVLSFSV
jgi:WD40 repeat protein